MIDTWNEWSPLSVYEQRLAVCKECDYLEVGTCLACGCYVELRAAVNKNKCICNKY
ncbi:MAG: hypothetical protein IKC46_12660 [Lachnospiraceae bacterium]|nr:hypothetical protein [Lachnospiraceae bacterium]